MYALGNLFTKEPAVIAGAIRTILWVLVLLGVVALQEAALAGIALALEVVLTLFVRQTVTPLSSPTLPIGTEVNMPGTSDTVIVQPTPPGPVAVEGGADPNAGGAG
jgi:hypothetical protein